MGRKWRRCRQHILACSTVLPKGALTEAGKDAGNTPRARERLPAQVGLSPSSPAGLPCCRQPKPAVSDPPLVAIKHSQVHEPAATATCSERQAGSGRWHAGLGGSWPRQGEGRALGQESDGMPSPVPSPSPNPPSSLAAGRMLRHGEKVVPGPYSILRPPFNNK